MTQVHDSCSTCISPEFSYEPHSAAGYFSLSDLEVSKSTGCRLCSLLLAGLTQLPMLPEDALFLIEDGSNRIYHSKPPMLRIRIYDPVVYSISNLPLLEIYTLPGTPDSIFCSNALDVSPEINIGNAVDRINHWMNSCKEEHLHCHTEPSLLPSRVLDISSLESTETIHLVETSQMPGEYVALSHCWGKNHPMISTTTGNLSARKAGIEFSDLSKTFQDAVQLAFAIKVRYIWIDSLCIIQDSKDDWEEQSSQMANIYANSTLNIASTAARDGDGGLFRSRWAPDHESRCSIQSYPIPGSLEAFGSTHYIRRSLVRTHQDLALQITESAPSLIETAPLLSRGWVLQERLLSPRTVNFHSGEMAWDCNSQFICECGGFEFDRVLPTTHMGKPQWLSKRSLMDAENTHTMVYRWHQLIEQYMKLSLTEDSDVLPAFSGMASSFKDLFSRVETDKPSYLDSPSDEFQERYPDFHVRQKGPNKYLAGLWLHTLSRNLLWYIENRKDGPMPCRTITYRAPTWSWASMDLQSHRNRVNEAQLPSSISELAYVHGVFDPEPHFTVLYSDCSLSGSNEYGAVTGGLLRIRGLVLEVPMVRDESLLGLSFARPVAQSWRNHDNPPVPSYIIFDTDVDNYFPKPETKYMIEILVLGAQDDMPRKGIIIWRKNKIDKYIRIGCLNINIHNDVDEFRVRTESSQVRTMEII